MKRSIIVLLGASALFFIAACQQKSDASNSGTNNSGAQHADVKTTLAGRWVAIDFCSRVSSEGSVAKIFNQRSRPFAVVMEFSAQTPGTVLCGDGDTTWQVPIKINVDTIELIHAVGDKSVFLVYEPDTKDLQMFNTTSKPAQMDRFTKSTGSMGTINYTFAMALNHNLLNGTYASSGNKIQFEPSGTMTELGGYNRYRVCIGRECLPDGTNLDAIQLWKQGVTNSPKWFGIRMSPGSDTLSIFDLVQKKTDSTTTNVPGAVKFRLVRQKPAPQQPKTTPPPAPAKK
jgi:hypothetical protein